MSPEMIVYMQHLAARLDAAPYGERQALVDAAAADLHKSVSTVFRRLAAVGWSSGRQPRADKGRTKVTPALARIAAGLVINATRANKKQTMTIKGACAILAGNGYGAADPATGEVTMPSLSTMTRIMRREGCHPRQLAAGRPAVEMRSLRPNHVWQIDGSQCVVFYLKNGLMGVAEEREYYKNKPRNLERIADARVWRYIVVDHYSGAFYLRYFLGAENAVDVAKTLAEAMLDRGPADPMRGRPEILLLDKGSGNTSGLFKRFCESCGIRPIYHDTGNSRVKGAVEQAQNLVETEFEGRLSYMGVRDLEHLQALADRYRIHVCARKIHTRHGRTRSAMWATIKEKDLIVPLSRESLLELITWEHNPVTVSPKLLVSVTTKTHGRHDYDVRAIPGVSIGDKFEVAINPFRAPAVDLTREDPDGTVKTWTVAPVERDAAGFRADAPVIGEEIRAMPKTMTDCQLDAIQRDAYATDSMHAAISSKARKERAYTHLNFMADAEASTPLYITAKGAPLQVHAAKPQLPPLSIIDAAFQLANRCPSWSDDPAGNLRRLEARFPQGVPADKIDDLATAMNQPTGGVITPFLPRTAGGSHE